MLRGDCSCSSEKSSPFLINEGWMQGEEVGGGLHFLCAVSASQMELTHSYRAHHELEVMRETDQCTKMYFIACSFSPHNLRNKSI